MAQHNWTGLVSLHVTGGSKSPSEACIWRRLLLCSESKIHTTIERDGSRAGAAESTRRGHANMSAASVRRRRRTVVMQQKCVATCTSVWWSGRPSTVHVFPVPQQIHSNISTFLRY